MKWSVVDGRVGGRGVGGCWDEPGSVLHLSHIACERRARLWLRVL